MATKKFTAKKIKTPKSYTYLADIKKCTYTRASMCEKADRQWRTKRKLNLFVAPRERPERDEI